MSDFRIQFTFAVPCNQTEAERFYKFTEFAVLTNNGHDALLDADIVQFFDTHATWTPENVALDILGSDDALLAQCRYDATAKHLLVWSDDGTPDVNALGEIIRRLYPEKLPLGFEWSCSTRAPRLEGFGGGYVIIEASGLTHGSTHIEMTAALRAAESQASARPLPTI